MKAPLIRLFAVGAIGCALTLTSCVSPYAGPNERNGAVVGALGGAALGGIIGNQSRRGLEGAAIGGLLGSLAGQQIGASRDRRFLINNGWGYSGFRRTTPIVYSRSFNRGGFGWGGSPFLASGIGFNRGFGGFNRGFGGFNSGFGGFGFNRGIGGYCW